MGVPPKAPVPPHYAYPFRLKTCWHRTRRTMSQAEEVGSSDRSGSVEQELTDRQPDWPPMGMRRRRSRPKAVSHRGGSAELPAGGGAELPVAEAPSPTAPADGVEATAAPASMTPPGPPDADAAEQMMQQAAVETDAEHAEDHAAGTEKIMQQIAVNFKRESELSDAQREVFSRMRFPCNADGNEMYVKKVRYTIIYQMTMTAQSGPPDDGVSGSD